ncbi:MFS family permease [Arthrobacter stackebrandtii]|uniref:MFS family permease n=1 Tax=Arthrobacter stackebrandtii TaxID=272161 RepID=A0ABS4YYQ9_9MICC|nr:MFS transporter [Arthrobacter stackebrandtii]MBP2413936.1 MFS family permease [Arthrobacter stackebrandtii]PYH00499.1 MFS transporter [Arthrobacter stackebrandtii]
MAITPSTDISPAPAVKGGRYSVLPRLAGTGYIPLGLFARVPLAMQTIGVLTMVTGVSASYAVGGFAAGCVGVGAAVGAPVIGFLADRLGQKRVLLVLAVVNALLLAAVVLLSYTILPAGGNGPADGGTLAVMAAALLVGATSPQVGPLSRVRWMALSRKLPAKEQGPAVDTALSLEGTADEVTFVLGPALVGLLASLVAPWLPLVIAAAMTAVLVSLFAVHHTVEAVGPRAAASTVGNAGYVAKEKPNWFLVAVPVAGMLAMGTFFGSSQTALTAFTGVHGSVDQAGLMYAIMGLSSAFTALSVAYWPEKFNYTWRWVVIAGLMAAGSVMFLVPESLGQMGWVLLLMGLPVGPVMVSIFSVGSVVAPQQWMGTVMTALSSGIVAGTALGSAVSGALAQSSGYYAAFLVPIAAASTLFVLGLVSVVVLRRRTAR